MGNNDGTMKDLMNCLSNSQFLQTFPHLAVFFCPITLVGIATVYGSLE